MSQVTKKREAHNRHPTDYVHHELNRRKPKHFSCFKRNEKNFRPRNNQKQNFHPHCLPKVSQSTQRAPTQLLKKVNFSASDGSLPLQTGSLNATPHNQQPQFLHTPGFPSTLVGFVPTQVHDFLPIQGDFTGTQPLFFQNQPHEFWQGPQRAPWPLQGYTHVHAPKYILTRKSDLTDQFRPTTSSSQNCFKLPSHEYAQMQESIRHSQSANSLPFTGLLPQRVLGEEPKRLFERSFYDLDKIKSAAVHKFNDSQPDSYYRRRSVSSGYYSRSSLGSTSSLFGPECQGSSSYPNVRDEFVNSASSSVFEHENTCSSQPSSKNCLSDTGAIFEHLPKSSKIEQEVEGSDAKVEEPASNNQNSDDDRLVKKVIAELNRAAAEYEQPYYFRSTGESFLISQEKYTVKRKKSKKVKETGKDSYVLKMGEQKHYSFNRYVWLKGPWTCLHQEKESLGKKDADRPNSDQYKDKEFTYFEDNKPYFESNRDSTSFSTSSSSLSENDDVFEKSSDEDSPKALPNGEKSESDPEEDPFLTVFKKLKIEGAMRQPLWMEEKKESDELKFCYSSDFDRIESSLYSRGIGNGGRKVLQSTNTLVQGIREIIRSQRK